ncbi:MAG: TIM barrel protein [Lachnospiraceae bacterium]|nr:TIM barrel protein [Lachnospiraceae bacterium]
MYKALLGLGTSANFKLSDADQVRMFAQVGFDAFFVNWEKGMDLDSVKRAAEEENMIFQSIHAPFLKAADMWTEGEKAQEAVEELEECLEDCAKYGVPVMVLHAFIGFEDHGSPNEQGVLNYGKVVEKARKLGVKLAFENTEGEEYLEMLMRAFADCEHVGFCWDTGHEMCYNYSKDMLALYGDRLFATHINDNLGIKDYNGKIFWTDDLHLLPFDGIGDWKDIADRMNRCGYDGILTFELGKTSKPNRHENDGYFRMELVDYLTESYKRACRVAALKTLGRR